jgi:D-serine deaminase-like pyridoxal phosphate-dependent protein
MMTKTYQDYSLALSGKSSPQLFLDLEAFSENINWVIKNAGEKKIRLATKSIRSPALLKKILNESALFQGLMTYTLEESLWLRDLGFKDILLAYPCVERELLEKLAQEPGDIILMTDRLEHLELLEEIAKKSNGQFSLCIDLDLSMDLPGLRFGVYRSWIHDEKRLLTYLDFLKKCQHLKLKAVMGYEAQIAGVGDLKKPVIKMLKALSLPQLRKRREKFVKIIQSYGHELSLINGGGTGSLSTTRDEKIVTEITVGSAFYAPTLFDSYEDFKLTPSLFFTSPIVRHPDESLFTVMGSGHIASGELTSSKEPQPYLPQGLKLLKHEGAGEVQTPLRYDGPLHLKVGDPIIFRHAKAGEICERFNHIQIMKDLKILETVETYRGMGKCFL